MNVTIGDALWRCAIVMVDAICVASQTMDDHKAHLEEVVSRLASRGHSLKPKKVRLLQEEVEYLGHVSTPRGIKITPGQRDAIIKMPCPLDSEGEVDETRLRRFIGLANFSWRYIDNFAMHAYILNGLLRKESAGIWTLAHAIAYDAIKYDIAWSKGSIRSITNYLFLCAPMLVKKELEVTFIKSCREMMRSEWFFTFRDQRPTQRSNGIRGS